MSVNQSIKPITTEEKDNLYIGGCDLTKLAEKYGTPLYIIEKLLDVFAVNIKKRLRITKI